MPTYDKHYKTSHYFGDPYPELVSFFSDYEPKGHVLDLGGGQGRDSITLARMGYKVTCVDISKVGISQVLSVAREENLDITGQVEDMYEYHIAEDVDIVLLDSILHFYPRDKDKETNFLHRIMDELKISGLVCILVWKSKNLETTLETVLESSKSVWSTFVDKYIDYPEKNMKMRMIVQEKTG